jgi:chromosome segregation ATPase
LVAEKKELETGLDEVKNNLMEQNNTASNSLKARLAEAQEKIVSLQTENDTLRNKESLQEKATQEDILLLETENKQLFDENRDLNDQLFELERQIAELKEKMSIESKRTEELCQQYETKLKSQSIDYDLLIKQAKAECIELKNELSNLQHQSSTATRMKRANKSLPNIPTTTSPHISPEYSPGEGRSLILSTMWQRDRESLKNVQQALEESENKLAFAKRQVIRLKKEVKCFQKYTFEQHHQQSEKQLEKGDDFTALQNGMDHANKRPAFSKRMSSTSSVAKKTLLPKTPPQHAIDFSPTIHGISSFMDELNGKNTSNNHLIKNIVRATEGDSQISKR